MMVAMAIVLRVDPVLIVEIVLQALAATVPVAHVANVLLVTVRPVDPVLKVAHPRVDHVLTVRLAIVQLVDLVLKVAVPNVRTVTLAVQSASPRAAFIVTP